MIHVDFKLNGDDTTVAVEPWERLLDTLRDRLGLTGTKEGCGEGECGACTVLIDGFPANACLVPTYQVRGRVVETIESVSASELGALHEKGATQCGACTPGVVMTALWIRRNADVLGTHPPRDLMAGNLCRCTGYDGIIEGLEVWMGEGRGEAGGEGGSP
jgi:aerobic-type carbon monoxide dehydrogenase small subunit (CoxS/CutS family)